jgi:hypothetical protein
MHFIKLRLSGAGVDTISVFRTTSKLLFLNVLVDRNKTIKWCHTCSGRKVMPSFIKIRYLVQGLDIRQGEIGLQTQFQANTSVHTDNLT